MSADTGTAVPLLRVKTTALPITLQWHGNGQLAGVRPDQVNVLVEG